MRHVGNMYVQLKTRAVPPRPHGVIEVSRVRRVDGHARNVAHITTRRSRLHGLANACRDVLSLVECRGRELRGKPMRGNDALHAHVKPIRGTQPLLDGDDTGARACGILHDSHAHHITCDHAFLGRARILRQHKEVMSQPPVERRDHAKGIDQVIRAHKPRIGTMYHALHIRNRISVVPVHGHKAHQDLVSVHALS